MRTTPLISVVVPTVPGRGASLARTLLAYHEYAATNLIETIVIQGRETCGEAWREGAALARGEYLHLSADDLVPRWDGWWRAAVELCKLGEAPAPLLYTPAGEPDRRCWDGEPARLVNLTRVPFVRLEWWRELEARYGEFPPLHYWSDIWLSDMLQAQRHPIRICAGYAFTHHWEQEGRQHDDADDRALYATLQREVQL